MNLFLQLTYYIMEKALEWSYLTREIDSGLIRKITL